MHGPNIWSKNESYENHWHVYSKTIRHEGMLTVNQLPQGNP